MNASPTKEELLDRDVAQLLREVESYLAAVDVFRAEGFEPAWTATEGPRPD